MPPLIRMIVTRCALGFLTLFIVSLLVFSAVNLLPGDVAEQILGQNRTPETVAAIRKELRLDRPPLERYGDWIGAAVRGDFGNSLSSGRPVKELIVGRLGNSFFLAGVAAVFAVPLSLALGMLAALYRGRMADRAISTLALTAISLPEFFIAYLLIYVLAVELRLLPAIANIPSNATFAERLYRTLLPALTLTLAVSAHIIRMTRAAIINLMSSPYIEMARMKGVAPLRIITHHALPNALAPIINVVALNLAYLVVGVVVVEVVFVYPGLGQLLVDSVSKRDITVVQTASLIFALTYILLNLLADVLSIATSPRLMHGR
ncbi:MAG: ABC transporter permease [Hyphomicrobiales bacterium]|jgi:peptide/nickel transport system permease protein